MARKNGYDGELLDFNTIINQGNIDDYVSIVRGEIARALNENPLAKVVGINVHFAGLFPRALEIADIVKEIDPERLIVMGGMHPSQHGDAILANCPSVDKVVAGEGEWEFVRLLQQHCVMPEPVDSRADGTALSSFSSTRELIQSVPTTAKTIRDLGVIDYSEIDFAKYRSPTQHRWHNPHGHNLEYTAPIITSRSCPFDCNFCSIHATVGGPKTFRTRPTDQVIEELRWLYGEWGINYIQVVDDIMNASKKQLMELCNAIIQSELDISIVCLNGLRLSTLDNESIDSLVEAGLIRNTLPIEHADEHIRNTIMGKGLSNDRIYEIATYFRDRHPHVWLSAAYVVGMPEETHDSLDKVETMIDDMYWVTPSVAIAAPYYATKLWDQCVAEDLFLNKPKEPWREFTFTVVSKKNLENQWALKHSQLTETVEEVSIRPYYISIEDLTKRLESLIKLRDVRLKSAEQYYLARSAGTSG
jgi:magnesium-protoporphyrin IX monomethyl ester (oxidative) cyclase